MSWEARETPSEGEILEDIESSPGLLWLIRWHEGCVPVVLVCRKSLRGTTRNLWEGLMVQLTFMLDGREMISSDALRQHASVDPVEKIMLLAVGKHVHRRVRNLSCLQHGRPPHIIAFGPSAERLTFSVEGCCGQLVAHAKEALQLVASVELPLAG